MCRLSRERLGFWKGGLTRTRVGRLAGGGLVHAGVRQASAPERVGWHPLDWRMEGELAFTGWVSCRDGGSALGRVGLKSVDCHGCCLGAIPELGGTKLAWHGMALAVTYAQIWDAG